MILTIVVDKLTHIAARVVKVLSEPVIQSPAAI